MPTSAFLDAGRRAQLLGSPLISALAEPNVRFRPRLCGNSSFRCGSQCLAQCAEEAMVGRYIEGEDRTQSVFFPERLDDWIDDNSTVRVVDVFVDELDLRKLGVGAERDLVLPSFV